MRITPAVRELKTGTRSFTQNFSRVNKSALRDAILAQLHADLALQVGAAQLARDEAISEESRAENKYDTHSQEAAYLAEGQAKLATEINENLALYSALPLTPFAPTDVAAVGALIEVGPPQRSSWFFLGPRAGGMEVKLKDREVLVLTPQSPLGRQFLGKKVGDAIVLPGRGKGTGQTILSIC